MRKFIWLILLAISYGYSQAEIVVTRDPNPNPDYVTYAEWLASHPEIATSTSGPRVIATLYSNAPVDSLKGLIALVVEEGLETILSGELNQYVEDLKDQGYDVEMSIYSMAGSAEDLRHYLAEKLNQDLIGAILVGELPVAWFQMNSFWDGHYEPPSYEEFPCDLYLSDLDGVWSDDSTKPFWPGDPLEKGSDGIYDSHSGNRIPEIWVSRIDASNISLVDPMTLYRNYLERIHDYRIGELSLPSKGLFFIDQDWAEYYYDENMNLVCGYYEEIRDTMITNAKHYLELIAEDGLYLTVCVHSSPWRHYFHDANKGDDCEVSYLDIDSIAPGYGFYNLFACSNCRWVEENCMGSIYQFSGKGLGVVGSAKRGSMLDFWKFNLELSHGKSWGEAFKEWTRYWLTDNYLRNWGDRWFMGMCLLGDGSLDLIRSEQYTSSDTTKLKLVTSAVTNGNVLVRFYLPEPGNANLSVFDLAGRQVESIYSGQSDDGIYSALWQTGNSPSGLYFIVLSTETNQQVCKVVTIR